MLVIGAITARLQIVKSPNPNDISTYRPTVQYTQLRIFGCKERLCVLERTFCTFKIIFFFFTNGNIYARRDRSALGRSVCPLNTRSLPSVAPIFQFSFGLPLTVQSIFNAALLPCPGLIVPSDQFCSPICI